MIACGVDLGSTTGKAVIIKDGEIILGEIVMATVKPAVTAQLAVDAAIKKAGLSSMKDLHHSHGGHASACDARLCAGHVLLRSSSVGRNAGFINFTGGGVMHSEWRMM